MAMKEFLLLLIIVVSGAGESSSSTDPGDVSALRSLLKNWENTPLNWRKSGDPCGESGDRWEGVNCSNSSVVELKLFNMGLEGSLSLEIGNLHELQTLDLSFNKLIGQIPSSIGMLKQLRILRLIDCSFSGSLPSELGNLQSLTILALNSNQFSGKIPASLWQLSNIEYLDLADNQLNGTLPNTTEKLVKAAHFHLNSNQLSGAIPSGFFNSKLSKIEHIILNNNSLIGKIPNTVGLVPSLKILRLDNNSLTGSVPPNITSLTNLSVLNLANNKLNGSMPNLTGMGALDSLDLSNNLFDPSEAPAWLSSLQKLGTLKIVSGKLFGEVPQDLFSLPLLQEVTLSNNSLNGNLNMSASFNQHLKQVNLQNNSISSVTLSSNYNPLNLLGNPVCNNVLLSNSEYCKVQRSSQGDDPSNNFHCSRPYEGKILSRAPYTEYNVSLTEVKKRIEERLKGTRVNFSVQGVKFDEQSNYLWINLSFCQSNNEPFTRDDILRDLDLNTQDLALPEAIGPCVFYPSEHAFKNKVIRGLTIGIAVGCSIGALIIAGLTVYAIRQRKQALQAIYLKNPFASWGSFGEDAGDAPQLKRARCFSLDELRKCTDDFSVANEIGSGGYGKVYKGVLPDGLVVAIKRASKGSLQGGLEFKTEIELLSRVHHLNLLELVGFCYEKGELLLVYEYISNGTLRMSLSGKSQIQLDWKRRLMIALDSARGLAYLHQHANPPIVHRDVKSSNILLDDNLIAKVADFGLSTFVMNSEEDNVSMHVKGTPGYVDPEYYMLQQFTAKSDVYSFGVVMIELITSKPPFENGKYIVKEVKAAFDRSDEEFCGIKDLIDPKILIGSHEGLQRFIELALKCLEETSEHRPTTNELVKEFEVLMTKLETRRKSTGEYTFEVEFGAKAWAPRHSYDEIDISSAGFHHSGRNLI